MSRLVMLHLPIDPRRLAHFASAHGLQDDLVEGDAGYVVHALLAALFGGEAPQPFALRMAPGQSSYDLLAYATRPLASLSAVAQLGALPAVYSCVDWGRVAEKLMPEELPTGMTLGFEVRACPVLRMPRGATAKAPGSEVDAFLAALDRGQASVDRGQVYVNWLKDRIPGADLLDVRVDRLRLARLRRRGTERTDGSRPLRPVLRPDATFAGTLRIFDPAAFATTLARGVGRHRSFGFGMLLLKPAAR